MEKLRLQTPNPDNFNVETWEGYINQLNSLLSKGIINEDEYIKDIERTNRNHDINLFQMFSCAHG